MINFIISILLALGVFNTADDYNNLTQKQQQEYQNQYQQQYQNQVIIDIEAVNQLFQKK